MTQQQSFSPSSRKRQESFSSTPRQDCDVNLTGFDGVTGDSFSVKQGYDNWDLFQVGGVIFF